MCAQDPERLKDPVDFVQQLLDAKDKFDAIVGRAFVNDKAFQNALNQAFEHFVNLNQRSPEYISLFMDDKLRKGLKVWGPVGSSVRLSLPFDLVPSLQRSSGS